MSEKGRAGAICRAGQASGMSEKGRAGQARGTKAAAWEADAEVNHQPGSARGGTLRISAAKEHDAPSTMSTRHGPTSSPPKKWKSCWRMARVGMYAYQLTSPATNKWSAS